MSKSRVEAQIRERVVHKREGSAKGSRIAIGGSARHIDNANCTHTC